MFVLSPVVHSSCAPPKSNSELQHLESTFLSNGYSLQKICSLMHTTLELARSNTTRRHDPSTRNLLVSIPYFNSNASLMKKSLACFDISTSFHSSANLKSLLSHTKSSCPPSSLKNDIYKIPCVDCLDYYIGQTCRPLIKRIKGHEASMRLDNHTDNSTGNIKSAPAKHRRDNGHCIDWKSTTILATCESKSQLNLMEHAAIKTHACHEYSTQRPSSQFLLESNSSKDHQQLSISSCQH